MGKTEATAAAVATKAVKTAAEVMAAAVTIRHLHPLPIVKLQVVMRELLKGFHIYNQLAVELKRNRF